MVVYPGESHGEVRSVRLASVGLGKCYYHFKLIVQEMQHNQVTSMEERIKYLESENKKLREQIDARLR